jgi:hypothetical protein
MENLELVHLYCHQQISARQATERARERRKRLADSSDKLEPNTVKAVRIGSNGAGGQ